MCFLSVCYQVDVEKPEEVRLIDLDETHSGEHTVFIMPPEEPQEPDGSECPALYRYSFTLTDDIDAFSCNAACPFLMLYELTGSLFFLSRVQL